MSSWLYEATGLNVLQLIFLTIDEMGFLIHMLQCII